MAYSFARSGRESYVTGNKDQSLNRGIEDSLSESRYDSGPEYLDLGFAWLNDYDKAGNYRPRPKQADGLTVTQQENPYGWNALGPTRRVPSRTSGINDFRQGSTVDLRKSKGAAELTKSRKGDVQEAFEGDLEQKNRSDFRQTSSRAELQQTRDLRQTNQTDLRQTKRDGLRNTTGNNFRDTIQLENFAETQKENPYGWKALGPTRRAPSLTTETEQTTRGNNFRTKTTTYENTVKENPYGWKALGRTRLPISHDPDTENTVRRTRKRTYQASFNRRSSRESTRVQSNARSDKFREIKHAKRLSVLQEENVQIGGLGRDGVLLTSATDKDFPGRTLRYPAGGGGLTDSTRVDTTGGGAVRDSFGVRALRVTTGAGGLRGTTYDYPYASNIKRESTPRRSSEELVTNNILQQIEPSRNRAPERTQPLSNRILDRGVPESNRKPLYTEPVSNRLHAHTATKSNRIPIRTEPVSNRAPEGRHRNFASEQTPEDTTRQWTNLATDYRVMGKWYELFAKIKKRWAANYRNPSLLSGLSDDESRFRPATPDTRPNETRRKVTGRRKLALISAAVFIVLVIAIVTPVTVLTAADDTRAHKYVLWGYNFQATILNVNFTEGMSNTSTEAFRNVSQPFCDEIGKNAINSSYKYIGCVITSLSEGSVVANFTVVINATEQSIQAATDVLATIGLSSTEQFLLGQFKLAGNVTVFSRVSYQDNNHPIPEKKKIGTNCTGSDVCKTNFSQCIMGICSCPDNRYHEVSRDTCLPIFCGVKPEVANGSSNASGNFYGNVLTIECDAGFELNGNNTIPCTSEDSWKALHIPTCKIIQCEDFMIPEHALLDPKNAQNLTFQDEIIISCEEGFVLTGENKTTCQATKKWSNTPFCEPVNCTEPDLPENVLIITGNSSYTFRSVVELNCSSGYLLEGKPNISCQSDRTWTEFPTCTPVTCPTFKLVNATILSKTGTQFGDVMELGCEDGFDLIGNLTIVCQASGTWSEYPMCKIKDCGESKEIENGWVIFENGTTFNSVATIECNDTFNRVGKANVKCLSDGNWESFPFCHVTGCGDFVPPENSYVIKENLSVVCAEGYELTGDSALTCFENGSLIFNGTCELITCFVPNVTDHLFTSYENEKEYTVGEKVNISCEEGFFLEGGEFLTCLANGEWSNTSLCIPTHCQVPELLLNAEIVDSSKQLFEFNETISIDCRNGFIPDGDDTLTCLPGGKWLGSFKCIPINCSLTSISEEFNTSNLQELYYSVNSIITLTCFTGYITEGNETVVCQPNGSWSAMPNCTPVICPIFDKPNNSNEFNFNETTKFQYLDIVAVKCDIGYNILGNENVTCEEDGNWTAIPECLRMQCDPYQLENGQTGNQTFYSEVLDIECDIGYDRSNNNSVTCSENGQWIGNVTCILA